jgi:hypothetical protein
VRILTSGQTPKIGAGGSKMDIVVLVAVGDKELVARRNIPRRAEIDPALDLVRNRQRSTDRCKVTAHTSAYRAKGKKGNPKKH